MQATDFTGSYPGRLVPTEGGALAFVPNPLPPADLEFPQPLLLALSEADRAIGRLDGVGRTLANPHLLIRPFVRREAVLSSKIEGTQASLSDVFKFEAAQGIAAVSPDVREVSNYVDALENALKQCKKIPVSNRVILETHRILLRGVRGQGLRPGHYRTAQNWIGSPGTPIERASFVPPPAPEISGLLRNFETYVNEPGTLPYLIKLAMTHYQFETIHPFVDGNGRIGRLLITLLLCVDNVLCQPLLYLSAYFERNRATYYHLLRRVSQQGAWVEWIEFFVKGVGEQANDAVRRAAALLDLREHYRKRLVAARSSILLLKLVDQLFVGPFFTIPMAASHLDVTYRSAKAIVEKLQVAKIVRPAKLDERAKWFVASKILELIDRPFGRS